MQRYSLVLPNLSAELSAAIVFLTLPLQFGCGASQEGKAKGPAAPPPVSVVVGAVRQKSVPIYAELTARTDASESVEIRARVKAYLATQNYREGAAVRKGQVLFTLDKREFEAQLMGSRAQLVKAEADLAQARERTTVESAVASLDAAVAKLNKADQDVNRLRPLAQKQAVPQQDYDNALAQQKTAQADVAGQTAALNTAKVNQTATVKQAEAAVESAQSSVRQAQLNIEFCEIKSPIDGIAGARLVSPGNLVGQGEATLLTTVSNVNPLRVYASVSEREYLNYERMRAEGKAQTSQLDLLLADGSVFPHKGQVIFADRAVDLQTGTLSIVAQFPNPTALVRPGQFGRIRLSTTVAENALLVPQKAVAELQNAHMVYLIGPDNKVQARSVTLGERVGEDYIVEQGLNAGDRIVVEGIDKVRPGAVVAPIERPVAAESARPGKGN